VSLEARGSDGLPRDAQQRPGGLFFFLDLAPGNYVLICTDRGGAVLQTKAVTIPASKPEAKLPNVSVDFRIGSSPRASASGSAPETRGRFIIS
jgi:hypothetical protein